MDFTQQIFCDNLRFLKKTEGLDNREMSEILGVSESVIDYFINGILPYDTPISVLYNIHLNFGVPPDAMIGDSEDIIKCYIERFKNEISCFNEHIIPSG
ncbi:MAG: helix-turn-helix transcriptional regulator [Ruminococcaceae bacterium]|nr:helix-turn-helix transcriptional regulator [Oscillospiraceae bacterium]